MELVIGVEPTTFSLQVKRSAIEPHQHILALVATLALIYIPSLRIIGFINILMKYSKTLKK